MVFVTTGLVPVAQEHGRYGFKHAPAAILGRRDKPGEDDFSQPSGRAEKPG
jgi:hypothetical protein